MKNNLRYFFIIFLFNFNIFFNASANEQFNFDVTELEILENGNKIIGSKKGIVTTNDGILIEAEKLIFHKLTNILEATGSVKFVDNENNYKIFADEITYFKNKETVKTKGNSKAIYKKGITVDGDKFEFNKTLKILEAKDNVVIKDLNNDYEINTEYIIYYKNEEKIQTIGKTQSFIQSKYDIMSSDLHYLVDIKQLSSKKNTLIKDKESQLYKLTKFNYQINDEILKGENILIITNHNLPKSDKFFFKNAIIDLKQQKFLAKDTNIKIHKNIFDNSDNDPRLMGVSSSGNEEITIVNKGTFTSCKINDDCPPWSISANKIVHNKTKKQLTYESALLKIYDVPVLYFPKFFHPDPTVIRQSGFLKPEINESDVLGSSLAIPYFKKITEDKDITITPTLFDSDMIMLENEYRKKGDSYSMLVDYGFVNNYNSPTTKQKKNLSHIFLKINQNLNLKNFKKSDLILSIEKVTNDTYLKVFDQHITKSKARPNNLNNLNNHAEITLDHENFTLNGGFATYENLQINKSDRFQYVLPYYNFNTTLSKISFPGTINFKSSGSNTLQDTNSLKSEIINDLNFNSRNYFSDLGFSTQFGLNLKNLNSVGKNAQNYKSSPQVELLSLINIDTSIPMVKKSEYYTNYLTPRLSFKFNPSDMKDKSSSTNTINVGNIFSNNRLGFNDTFEAGKSLTLGLNFKKEKKNNLKEENDTLEKINKYFEIKLATVLRDKEEELLPRKSTLNRKISNLFGSISNNFSDNLNLSYNFALDNNYKNFEYNSITAEVSLNDFITKFKFIEENGEMGDSNVFENEIGYKFNEKNYLSFNTRRNRKLNLTEYYNLVYEYKNDCLVAGIKYKKSYYEDRDLKPTENFLFTVTLFPLTTYEHDTQDLFKDLFN